MTSPRRVFAPERIHLSQAEKEFARAIQPHVLALNRYAEALHNYRLAANKIYNENGIPALFRPMMSGNRNYILEGRVGKIQNRTPSHMAFLRATNRIKNTSRAVGNSRHGYTAASAALRREYGMDPFLIWNRNQVLENRLKNRTVQTLQRRVRQKQTAKRIQGTAAFIRAMSIKGVPQSVTLQIISSLNRRR